MASNPAFVFPPPPPPPPRASDFTYQRQGHCGGGGRGRGRGSRGDGPRKPWEHNSPPRAQNVPQDNHMPAQPAYGQVAQPPPSYGYMPQQAVPAQPSFTPLYPVPHQAQASAAGSTFPLSSNGQYALPSGHGLPIPLSHYGLWQPSVAPNQTQIMGPPIRMGFSDNSGPSSMTPAFPHHYHPVNYAVSAYNAPPQDHHISSANNNSPFNGYQSHTNQSPNPNRPPNNNVSRGPGARRNDSRRGQQHHNSHKKTRNDAPRPKAPPAIPSFLSAALPAKPDASIPGSDVTGQGRKKKKRKYNALGLTPRTVEHEDSGDDVDEEMKLGNSTGAGEAQLQFEYRGRTSVLETSADITAWIEERKKRFPTQERIKAKEAEKERRWKEARSKKQEPLSAKQQTQGKQRSKKRNKDPQKSKGESEHVSDGDQKAEKAQRKREKIMRKLKEQQEKLQKLEAEMAGPGGLNVSDTVAVVGSKRKREDEGDDDSKVQHDMKEQDGIKDEDGGGAEVRPTVTFISQEIMGEKPEEIQMKDEIQDEHQVKSEPLVNLMSDPEVMKLDEPDFPVQPTPGNVSKADIKREVSISSGSSSMDDSSSIDSDSSSSSGKPDQQSSRRQTSAAQSSVPKPHPNAPICRQYLRAGHCVRENQRGGCPYRHELPPRKEKQKQPKKEKVWQKGPGMKKERHRHKKRGLYQRMLENDKEKEDLVVVQAVKYLGDNGFLSTDG
ncbi:MAG: hypothetical protein M1816_005389 [Peltula sp. TS41687]|nr:MAG: hypothetical protein M1816_005389 [Peltula sp. TS41687]